MIVSFKTRISCPTCQHKIGYFAVATVRINKRSLRTTGGGAILGALEAWKCPGCGTPVPRDRPLDREPYKLSDEDAVKVAAYRLKKWGVEDDGANVERVVAKHPDEQKAGR
jgi:endogenous inhibitor of DNA gyrase (YacG/DUF329 family)